MLILSMDGRNIMMVRSKPIRKTSALRRTTMPTKYRLSQEKQVIEALQTEEKTTERSANDLGWNYYTVRTILDDLLERGIVKVTGRNGRARVFGYNTGATELNDTIPRFIDVVNRTNYKFIYAIEGVGREDGLRSVEAAKRIPAHVTNLMYAANLASHGQDVNFRLDNIREALQRDMLYLKNAMSMLEQILDEPRFWEPEYLAKMADDPDYNFMAVSKAKELLDQKES
jgi:predicted transcriptional regulator